MVWPLSSGCTRAGEKWGHASTYHMGFKPFVAPSRNMVPAVPEIRM